MVQVNWTDSALQDLNDIGDYIARDSLKYAEIIVLRLFESVDILENHPLLGVMAPEFENKSISQLDTASIGSAVLSFFSLHPGEIHISFV